MLDSKPQSTPIVARTKLHGDGTGVFDDHALYKSTAGALQYACITRPDITSFMNKVSQFMYKPLIEHWLAVKRILRY